MLRASPWFTSGAVNFGPEVNTDEGTFQISPLLTMYDSCPEMGNRPLFSADSFEGNAIVCCSWLGVSKHRGLRGGGRRPSLLEKVLLLTWGGRLLVLCSSWEMWAG